MIVTSILKLFRLALKK
ncbi:hypothetical protein A2U01_0111637, partial [Trifolium medium]|nr:hypothetical protein [Trifolium medium]